ncbi:MAG: cytochrome c [FCB group bacterium]
MVLGLNYVASFDKIFTNKYISYEKPKPEVEVDVPFEKGTTSIGINLEKYASPNDSLIAKGKELFNSSCSPCHGETGKGDGPASAALNPKPRNFHSKDGWTNGRKFSDMYKTLQEGIIKNGMTAFEFLPVEDRLAIIHYIRTFENDFPKITNEEIKQLDDTYHLTQSGKIPNTIPVVMAMQKIIDENHAKYIIYEIVNIENIPSNEPGEVILNKVSTDKFRSLYYIYVSKNKITTSDNLIKEVSYTIPENGFNNKILNLRKDEREILFNYLLKLLK